MPPKTIERAVQADEWWTAEEVVAHYKLASVASLYTMRSRGTGPKGHKFGRGLRFKRSDLDAWAERQADAG